MAETALKSNFNQPNGIPSAKGSLSWEKSLNREKQRQKIKAETNSLSGYQQNRLNQSPKAEKKTNSSSETAGARTASKSAEKASFSVQLAKARENAKNQTVSKKPAEKKSTAAQEQTISATVKKASQASLTSFWGSVWLDWTFFSLIYLNGHLAASLFFPNQVCQFGEDNLFGKWIPMKSLAKITEIIFLIIIDVIILGIIVITIYFIYQISKFGLRDWAGIGLRGAIPGGETATEAILRKATEK